MPFHQSGGGFQLRVLAGNIGGVNSIQRLLDLACGQALLPQILGSGAAALFCRQQGVGTGLGIACLLYTSRCV